MVVARGVMPLWWGTILTLWRVTLGRGRLELAVTPLRRGCAIGLVLARGRIAMLMLAIRSWIRTLVSEVLLLMLAPWYC